MLTQTAEQNTGEEVRAEAALGLEAIKACAMRMDTRLFDTSTTARLAHALSRGGSLDREFTDVMLKGMSALPPSYIEPQDATLLLRECNRCFFCACALEREYF